MQQKVESLEAVSGLWPQVKALSYLELKALSDAIAGEMQEKSDAVRADLRQRMAALSEEYGLSVKDVIGKKKRRAKKAEPTGEPKPARVRNPDQPEETWSGVGRKPKWLTSKLAAGADLASFAVAQPREDA